MVKEKVAPTWQGQMHLINDQNERREMIATSQSPGNPGCCAYDKVPLPLAQVTDVNVDERRSSQKLWPSNRFIG
jgi:hypothetical protein